MIQRTGLLLLALLLGGFIGWERERHERPAGLRTHILVCVGAALITQVSQSFGVNGDRIAAQIVTGVGFLGAGTIIREGTSGVVRGLTTAATLWAIAGVGIAVGYGGVYAALATIATFLILFTLTLLNTFEDDLIRQRRRHALTVFFHSDCSAINVLSKMLETLRDKNVKSRNLTLARMGDLETAHMQLVLSRYVNRDDLDVTLGDIPEIVHFEWND